MGICIAMFIFGTSPAYAVFGIRAARTVLAARKAKQMNAASSSTSEEAYAQEKARFRDGTTGEAQTGLAAESRQVPQALKD